MSDPGPAWFRHPTDLNKCVIDMASTEVKHQKYSG